MFQQLKKKNDESYAQSFQQQIYQYIWQQGQGIMFNTRVCMRMLTHTDSLSLNVIIIIIIIIIYHIYTGRSQ
jgi:hypothetical protein